MPICRVLLVGGVDRRLEKYVGRRPQMYVDRRLEMYASLSPPGKTVASFSLYPINTILGYQVYISPPDSGDCERQGTPASPAERLTLQPSPLRFSARYVVGWVQCTWCAAAGFPVEPYA